MNRNFSQTITVRCDDPAPIIELLLEWDRDQAQSDIMGYMGTRLLADREKLGQYVIIADFGVVDPSVSAADEAERNNSRPETRPGGELGVVYTDAPSFHIIDHAIYHTDLDRAQLVPEPGLEAAVRAFAKIIDSVNVVDLGALRAPRSSEQ